MSRKGLSLEDKKKILADFFKKNVPINILIFIIKQTVYSLRELEKKMFQNKQN